jgi:hypothetical protein
VAFHSLLTKFKAKQVHRGPRARRVRRVRRVLKAQPALKVTLVHVASREFKDQPVFKDPLVHKDHRV